MSGRMQMNSLIFVDVIYKLIIYDNNNKMKLILYLLLPIALAQLVEDCDAYLRECQTLNAEDSIIARDTWECTIRHSGCLGTGLWVPLCQEQQYPDLTEGDSYDKNENNTEQECEEKHRGCMMEVTSSMDMA
jgi:hypothetical protein